MRLLCDPKSLKFLDNSELDFGDGTFLWDAINDAMSACATLRTLERDGAIVVAIADNGAGIPTGSLPRLFDPFSEGSGDGPTAGLGLALAHDLVRRAGGSIKVESEPGTGTRFEVVLPLADAPAPVVETA